MSNATPRTAGLSQTPGTTASVIAHARATATDSGVGYRSTINVILEVPKLASAPWKLLPVHGIRHEPNRRPTQAAAASPRLMTRTDDVMRSVRPYLHSNTNTMAGNRPPITGKIRCCIPVNARRLFRALAAKMRNTGIAPQYQLRIQCVNGKTEKPTATCMSLRAWNSGIFIRTKTRFRSFSRKSHKTMIHGSVMSQMLTRIPGQHATTA